MDEDFDASTRNVDAENRTDTLCPFDASVACKSRSGCMACDDGVKCCKKGESCSVTVEAQTPCPFVSYMPSCMMCDNERGEPTLVSAKPGDTCKATNMCTTFSAIAKYDPLDTLGDNRILKLGSGSGSGSGSFSNTGIDSHAPSFTVGSRGGAVGLGSGLTANYTKKHINNSNFQRDLQQHMFAASMHQANQNQPHQQSAMNELKNRDRRRFCM